MMIRLPSARRACALTLSGVPRASSIAALAVAAVVVLLTRPLVAQEVRGVLTTTGNDALPGILVEATAVSTGFVIGRALSGTGGRFRLDLPADSAVALRALRIGHRPTVLDTIRVAAGEIREGRWVLTGPAIALERVQIVGRDICGAERTDGNVVVTLLEEVWKAVRSTQVRSTTDPLTAEWVLHAQQTSLEGQPLTERTEEPFAAATDRPFVSLPPDSLAAVGYLQMTEDGYQLFAPDADVLLSSHFLNDHCFRTEPWRADDRDWIGLGFRPIDRRRGVAGIEGTLWLDRSTAELRRLEYRYVNLPNELATRAAGGEVEFLRLATGAWLVNRWSIRMPRVAETYTHRPGLSALRTPIRTLRVTSLQVAGGELRAIHAGAQTLYRADATGPMAPVVLSAEDAAALCVDSLAARTGVLWGISPALATDASTAPARLVLSWTANRQWFDSARRSAARATSEVSAASNGLWVACGIPANELVEVVPIVGGDTLGISRAAWIAAGELGARVALELSDTSRAPPPRTMADGARDSDVEADAGPNAEAARLGTVFGRVVDSLQVGRRAGEISVRVAGSARRATPDADGRFAIDSLAPGEHTLAAWDERHAFLGVPAPLARVRVGLDGSAEGALLATPTRGEYFATLCAREPTTEEGLLVGEIRDLAGNVRTGMTVQASWTSSQIRAGGISHAPHQVVAKTDARGRYVLCGVPAGDGLYAAAGTAVSRSPVSLVAVGEELASGTVTLEADSAWLRRRDLIVGRAAARTRLGGRIVDHLNRPIAGATVLVSGSDSLVARTTESGAWVLDGVPVRSLELTVRALGYLPADVPLDPVSGRLTAGEVRLDPLPQYLDAVVVRGVRVPTSEAAFEERRRSLAFGTFLDEQTLRRQPVVTPDFLAHRTPRSRAAGGTIVIESTSGFAALAGCFPLWFVDGIDYGRVSGSRRGAIAFMQDEVLRTALRIEIYRASLSPAEYSDSSGCGAVVVWTR
jgi:hypothetical protein